MKLILATVAVAIALHAIPFSTVCAAEDKDDAKRVELTGTFKEQKNDRIVFVVKDKKDAKEKKYNLISKLNSKAKKFLDESVDIVAKVRPGKIEGNQLIVYLGKIKKVSDSQ